MRRIAAGTWIWDIRVNPGIIIWRRECLKVRYPYYWKLNVLEAKDMVDLLADSYGVRPCRVRAFHSDSLGKRALAVPGAAGGLNGCYFPSMEVMYIHGRAHIKTVVHEFYHHLDNVTEGEYDSDDHPDGSHGRTTKASLAWQFADRFWEALKTEKVGLM